MAKKKKKTVVKKRKPNPRPKSKPKAPKTAKDFPARATPAEPGRVRVLIAKPGLDGHDRGAKVIARALRDAGFEVIYTGLHQTPEMVINAAVDEDVQVVGISVLSGAHLALVPEIISGLRKKGLGDALLLLGGIIPDEDIPVMRKAGVAMVFTPGASLEQVVKYIREHAPSR